MKDAANVLDICASGLFSLLSSSFMLVFIHSQKKLKAAIHRCTENRKPLFALVLHKGGSYQVKASLSGCR